MVRPKGLCFGWDTDFALSGVVGKLYDAPLYLYGMGDSALARLVSRNCLAGAFLFAQHWTAKFRKAFMLASQIASA